MTPHPGPTIIQRLPAPSIHFPPAWVWFMDEAITGWVKKSYSPKDAWKDKPFSKEDGVFFFKGINELSEMFTEERPKNIPAYFQHAKFRSSYLLYFLPLQAAKFVTLFQMHSKGFDAALQHGLKNGVLRVTDLGVGPGTASIAFLLKILGDSSRTGVELPMIELEWFDTNRSTMDDGRALVEMLASHFARLRGKVTINTHEIPWYKAASVLKHEQSLILMGHVVNEATGPQNYDNDQTWGDLLAKAKGGGLLIVEPASRRPSQQLSQLRNRFFENEIIEKTAASLWGPCLHAQTCPMSDGRDWCHFSVPVEIPGKWFKEFSKALGSERQWLKFSYLWLTSSDARAPMPEPKIRRVISDPLTKNRESRESDVLICEPDVPNRVKVSSASGIVRGDLIKIVMGESKGPIPRGGPSSAELESDADSE